MMHLRGLVWLAALAFIVPNNASPGGQRGKGISRMGNQPSLWPRAGSGLREGSPPPDDFPPLDEPDHAAPLDNAPTPAPAEASSSQPTEMRVTFPPEDVAPVLSPHYAAILNANTYQAISVPVPADMFTPPVRASFLQWSKSLLSDPNKAFRYHQGWEDHGIPGRKQDVYLYMYRPMSEQDVEQAFRRVNLDWHRTVPIAAYRVRVPQSNLLSSGEVEVAGVQMIYNIQNLGRTSSGIPVAQLRQIAELVKRGQL